jgi:hypothetical protein
VYAAATMWSSGNDVPSSLNVTQPWPWLGTFRKSAQCPAVKNTFGAMSVPEQTNSSLKVMPTYGWRFPSGWPWMIAPAGGAATSVRSPARAKTVSLRVVLLRSRSAAAFSIMPPMMHGAAVIRLRRLQTAGSRISAFSDSGGVP